MTTEQAPTLLAVEVTIDVDGTARVQVVIESRDGPLRVRRVVASEMRRGTVEVDFAKMMPGYDGVGPGYLTAVRVLDLRGRP